MPAAAATRVACGLRQLSRAPRDFVVVGGGYAGCNALSALQHGSQLPGAAQRDPSVLCASLSPPGGSWNAFYEFARLHAPHPEFGVSGQPWGIQDPNVLATRAQVLAHFQEYVDALPPSFEFATGLEFLGASKVAADSQQRRPGSDDTDGDVAPLLAVQLRDAATGEETEVCARHVVDARGYFFMGHRRRDGDSNFGGSDLPEVQVHELDAKLAEATAATAASASRGGCCQSTPGGTRTEAKAEAARVPLLPSTPTPRRLYVVIGGGKTGLDAVLHIARQRRSADEDKILLVTGRTKLFLRRDAVFPPKSSMDGERFSPFTLGDLKMDLVLGWDGTNEADLLRQARDAGAMFSLLDRPAATTFFGCLSDAERDEIHAAADILRDDYFVGCERVPTSQPPPPPARGADASSRPLHASPRHRLLFKHASPRETDREVVLVNCRSSVGEHSHHARSVHPVRPDGTLRFGSLAGFTGPSHFLFSLLLSQRGGAQKIAQLPLYGHRHALSFEASNHVPSSFIFGFLASATANAMAIVEALGGPEILRQVGYTGDVNRWYPPAQQEAIARRLRLNAPALRAVAAKTCRRLVPCDEQPR